MILSIEKLKEFLEKNNLVENLSEKEKNKEEGASFDIRVGEIYEFSGEGFLGINERKTPDIKLLGKYEENQSKKIKLEQGKYYVIKTMEKLNTPTDLASKIITRSTLLRSGIMLLGGFVDPGFRGELTLGLINISNQDFTIELGSRVANLVFHKVEGKTKEYKGNYQDGEMTTDKI